MAWRDTLQELKEELAQVRAERQREAEAEETELRRQRGELSQLAGSLGISELLAEINDTLLEGRGEIETIVSWEPEEEEDDDDVFFDGDEDEDEADVIAAILSWDEGGEREISIDLGQTEQRTYLQVNGVDIRPEREALEPALLQAFRDELEL
jgi:hypothetical protein